MEHLRSAAALAAEIAGAYAAMLAAEGRASEALRSGTMEDYDAAIAGAAAAAARAERAELEMSVLRAAARAAHAA